MSERETPQLCDRHLAFGALEAVMETLDGDLLTFQFVDPFACLA